MRKVLTFLILLAFVALFGCEQRTDKTDSGGVLLSVSDFDGLPAEVNVNVLVGPGGDRNLIVGSITIENIAKDPTGVVGPLMNVEMSSYEVTFSRADRGTLLPPPMVQPIFGVTPVNGEQTYDNLRILSIDQIQARPIADLLFENGGFDKETGETFARVNFHIRFFGRTLSGDAVQSNTFSFTVTFIP